jgi:hypothetical protein
MKHQSMNLNIRYDAPKEVWEKIPMIYAQTDGWLGDENNPIPNWFSYDEEEKYITASVEPSGLHFEGLMEDEEWIVWKQKIKQIATQELNYKVGEMEDGEVDY